MSKPSVELDFFGMEKESSCKSQFQKFLDRRRSFRGLQSAISKMNPEVIKSVIASGLTNPLSQDQIDSNKSSSVPSSPKEPQSLFPALPLAPDARAASENGPETAPLTIFYNGTVSVFNVPRDKVERILKHAVEGVSKNFKSIDSKVRTPTSDQQQLLETLEGDLPIARRKSLQRFLEKRKERLTCAFSYDC
ncbi:protein TIFY 9-like [Hibiscus syriacus]|uniref:protein TIFY 9-like n=1 Tax=Hibiscus syriacus TaxID=106335 RepID=UPI0019231265|nr:protein TIFY 9-like [Hibiscus syriacus]